MAETSASESRSAQLPRGVGWVLACVAGIQFLVSLDLSLVNVALPAIQADVGLSDAALSWVVTAYVLLYGGFLLAGGRLGDLFSRRHVLVIGMSLFGIASVLGGLAPNGGVLIAARALQGFGAALVAPAALALVTVYFPEGQGRSKALGLWAGATLIGGALGVVLSGVLTEIWGWRAVMFVNVPIVLACSVAVLRLPEQRPQMGIRIDVAGAVLVTAGMASLVFGVSMAELEGWSSPWTLGPAVAGVAALAAFVLVERRAIDPMMRLDLFRHRAVVAANVFALLVTGGQLASFFFVSLHMQQVLGFDALATGVAFLPFCLGSAVAMAIATKLLPRLGPRALLVTGGLIGALGIAWFSLGSPDGTFLSDILGPSIVTSLGLGAGFVAMGGAATTGVPQEDAGMVSGLLNSSRLLGGSLGLAALATLAGSVTSGSDESGVAAASAGYSAALLCAAGLVALGALACLSIPRGADTAPKPDADTATAPRASRTASGS
ncbi:MFS transporter [Nocardia puris]|uniref:MFS transporter n=1 Tax=Nocardia puris TaxID=208602 RepID=UPI002B4AB0AA|nr:MFS transporter [Nocardia puris]